jgi:gas vesicle protein
MVYITLLENLDGGMTMLTQAKSNGFWQGILIGGAVATVSALLYAPKARKQFRKKISDFFQSNKKSKGTALAPLNQTINSMAQNEHEMAKLGEEMKYMKTNSQVKDSGMVPDPIQYE